MRHNQLDRELALMLMLTENRDYTVQQMCERLDISRRSLYYYLEFFRDNGCVDYLQVQQYGVDGSAIYFVELLM